MGKQNEIKIKKERLDQLKVVEPPVRPIGTYSKPFAIVYGVPNTFNTIPTIHPPH